MAEEKPAIDPTIPVCPHCGQDPATISCRPVMLGQIQAVILFCGNVDCRKIFATSVISIEQPRVMPPPVQFPRERMS